MALTPDCFQDLGYFVSQKNTVRVTAGMGMQEKMLELRDMVVDGEVSGFGGTLGHYLDWEM